MDRRTLLIGGLMTPVFLGIINGFPNHYVLACPPAKYKPGMLVEHKSGVRLVVIAGTYKNKKWLYDLGYDNQVFMDDVPECDLKKVD